MDDNTTALMGEINPVFLTAKSCLVILSKIKDEDAQKLLNKLGFVDSQSSEEQKNIPKEKLEMAKKIAPAFYSQVEMRFFGTNEMILNDKTAKIVLDLGCGYTPRGIKLANSSIKYIGLDLPAVINTINPAIKDIIGDNQNIHYHSADLTNYSSICEAIGDNQGELFITTEGVINYLYQFELEEVINNIKKLLKKYGGKWVTCDNTLLSIQQNVIAASLGMTSNNKENLAQIGMSIASSMAKIKKFDNIFLDKDIEKIKKFLDDKGFKLNIEKGANHIPKFIRSLAAFPENILMNMRKVLEDMDFWILTLKEDIKEEKQFKLDIKRDGEIINIKLEGRLDTISSPTLIEAFHEEEKKGNINKVIVDMENIEFISSGGIRALTIIDKSLRNEKNIEICNIKEEIKKIILSNDFADIVEFNVK